MNMFIKEDIKPGSEVVLIASTTSLQKGSKVIVESFLGDNPEKIVCKGLLPGGYIPISKIDRKPKLIPGLRFKTILEFIKDHGIKFCTKVYCGLTIDTLLYLGTPLKMQDMERTSPLHWEEQKYYKHRGNGFNFSATWLTDKPLIDDGNSTWKIKIKDKRDVESIKTQSDAFNQTSLYGRVIKSGNSMNSLFNLMVQNKHLISIQTDCYVVELPFYCLELMIHTKEGDLLFSENDFDDCMCVAIKVIQTPKKTIQV